MVRGRRKKKRGKRLLFIAALCLCFYMSLLMKNPVAATDYVIVGLTNYTNISSVQFPASSIDISASYGGGNLITLNGAVFEITILPGSFAESGRFSSYNEALVHTGDNGGIPAHNGSNWTVYDGGGTIQAMVVRVDGRDVLAFNMNSPLFIRDSRGVTNLGTAEYRGYLRPAAGAGSFTITNAVSLDEYLYSVVPSEMPPGWHIEALKAQAVAARTYFIYSRGRSHPNSGFDICDATHCQVYGGVSRENASTNRAVDETSGIMIYYDNQPINAVYSSSSGGHTEGSENVWGGPVPYLRGVREVAENEPRLWDRTYTFAQIEAAHNIGAIHSVTVSYLPSGRAGSLTFNGSSGSRTYERDSIRGFSSGIDSPLLSNMFSINGLGGFSQAAAVAPLPAPVQGTQAEVYVSDGKAVVVKPVGDLVINPGGNTPDGGITAIAGDGGTKQYAMSAPSGQETPGQQSVQ